MSDFKKPTPVQSASFREQWETVNEQTTSYLGDLYKSFIEQGLPEELVGQLILKAYNRILTYPQEKESGKE